MNVEEGNDFEEEISCLEGEKQSYFGIFPQVVQAHAVSHKRKGDNYEFMKHQKSDEEVRYVVMRGVEYDEEDPTQFRWEWDYGVNYRPEDAKATFFANYEPSDHDNREAAARYATRFIRPAFKDRTRCLLIDD